MKKIVVALSIVMTTGFMTASAHWSNSYDDFHSWNKPLNPTMANQSEMTKYKADLDAYLKEMNAEIAKINAKKAAAIAEYNKVVSEYNSDQFFHKGTFKHYKQPKKIMANDKDYTIIIINDKDKNDDDNN